MSRKIGTLILIALVFSILSPPQTAYGMEESQPDDAATRRVTFVDLGYTQDETFKGVLVARDFTVRWPDAWEVRPGNVLTLEFSHSLALHPSSSLAVDWNGARLASTLLTAENADHASLQVPIPDTRMLTGFNRLRIELYMGIHEEDFCQDEDNPALWTTVHNTSSLLLSYEGKQPEPDLSLFPVPFIDNSTLVENQVTFLLPGQPTPAELSALAAVTARLGELAAWRPLQVGVLSAEQAAREEPAGDLIAIGAPDRIQWPVEEKLPFIGESGGRTVFVDADGQALPAQAGLVWEQASPYDPTSVLLLVTGTTEQGLQMAARGLASAGVYPRFSGQMGMVLDLPDPDPGSVSGALGRSFTLEALGYPDITTQGSWEQTIHYIFPVQHTWQTQSEAVIDLHFAHSQVLHPRRSSLSVLLNGTPVGSIALDAENAVDAHTTFRLPARLFKAGNNQLTITANLRMPDEYEDGLHCLDNTYREAWVVVYADSLLRLPDSPAGLFVTLEDYPAVFLGAANLSDLVFVVPPVSETTPSLTIAGAVASLAEGLGRSVSGRAGTDILAPGVVDPQAHVPENAHRILVGLPTQNAAISALNDRLPQPFQPGTDQPAAVDSLPQVVPAAGAAGFAQAALDEYGMPVLVVTGTTEQGVAWAADVLADPDLHSTLNGDLAIVEGPSRFVTAEVRYTTAEKLAAVTPPETTQTAALAPTSWVGWLAGAVFILAVLILVVVGLVEVQHKQKSRRYGSHTP